MIDVGTAPGSSNVAKIIVSENHPGTMLIIGADTGAPDGPARKIDVFEDVQVHGNACVGELKAVRVRWAQGVDGTINQGEDDEVPRIEKLAGDERLHIIGGGPLNGPGRDVVLWDDVRVTNDLNVAGSLTLGSGTAIKALLTGSATVDPVAQGSPYGPVNFDITVTGAAMGDLPTVPIVTSGTLPDDVFIVVREVNTDTVTCEVVNLTGALADVGSITVVVGVLDIT